MTDSPAATATVSVRVSVEPRIAFEVFTAEIDAWWGHGPKFRHAGHAPGTVTLERGVGGRLFESWRDESGEQSFELGQVTDWEPPDRLVFTWRNSTFAPLERTEVEVTFVAVSSGTLVTVRHRGFESLRDDHPVRHGMDDVAFARALGMHWEERLAALRRHAAERNSG